MRNVLGASLEVVGAVTSGGLAQEYAGADVLAYPSLHEGFGLPLLEGMAAGLPVVCSSATCLPEVAGNAAQLVDPADVEGWATALASALKEPGSWSARGRARVAEFSWATTASVVREAMDFAVG